MLELGNHRRPSSLGAIVALALGLALPAAGCAPVDVTASIDASGDRMTGRFDVTSGGCAGTEGSFELAR